MRDSASNNSQFPVISVWQICAGAQVLLCRKWHRNILPKAKTLCGSSSLVQNDNESIQIIQWQHQYSISSSITYTTGGTGGIFVSYLNQGMHSGNNLLTQSKINGLALLPRTLDTFCRDKSSKIYFATQMMVPDPSPEVLSPHRKRLARRVASRLISQRKNHVYSTMKNIFFLNLKIICPKVLYNRNFCVTFSIFHNYVLYIVNRWIVQWLELFILQSWRFACS